MTSRVPVERNNVQGLQALLDVVSDGVLATDINGVRTYSNRALDDLVGGDACLPRRSSAPPAFLPPEDYNRYLEHIDRFQKGPAHSNILSLEWGIVRADGQVIETAMHLLPVRSTSGDLAGMLWVFHVHSGADELRRRALEQAVEQIRQIVAGVESSGDVLPQSEGASAVAELSHREREVLELLLLGHRVSTVADTLCLSTHTVRNHLKSIFRKADVHSQAELIQVARGSGDGNGGGPT